MIDKGHYDSIYNCGCRVDEHISFYCKKHKKQSGITFDLSKVKFMLNKPIKRPKNRPQI